MDIFKRLKRGYTLPGLIICIIGLIALWALYAFWLSDSNYSIWAYISAFVSVILFALVCLRFVPVWMRYWTPGGYVEAEAAGAEPVRIRAKLFVFGLIWCLGIFLVTYIIYICCGYSGAWQSFRNFWTLTDSQHYLAIARDWYLTEGVIDRLVQLVFLPGYPLAIRFVHLFISDWVVAALLVSWLSFAGALPVIYSLLRLDFDHRASLRAIKYLCIIPGSFFFVAPMSESLFLLLSVLCVYLARRQRWVLGCIFGALAAFTRSLGLMLFVPVCMELIHDCVNRRGVAKSRRVGQFASLLLIPAGFGVYILINYLVSGDPFQYMVYQREHWGQGFGFFFATAGYQLDNAINCVPGNMPNFWGLWLPNVIFDLASLAIVAIAAKKLRPSYAAWFIAYYVIAIGATWLLSSPRYLISLLPFFLAVSMLAGTERRDRIATVICIPLWLCYELAFVLRWQVW